MINFILGLFIGGISGVITLGLVVASKNEIFCEQETCEFCENEKCKRENIKHDIFGVCQGWKRKW